MLTLGVVLAVLTGAHSVAQGPTRVQIPRPPINPVANPGVRPNTFYVLAFAGTLAHGKCLDFGPPPQVAGSPVFIFDCNGTASQQVLVEEINNRHQVILHVGTKVIGIRNPPKSLVSGGPPAPASTDFVAELQNRANPAKATAENQVFALDGDSIILASSLSCMNTPATACLPPPPQLVVQVQNARGKNRTPLIVGPRNLADSEFWDFQATDHSLKYPTSGFKTVAALGDLLAAIGQINQIAQQNNGAAWGSVIRILDSGKPIDLTANPACSVNTGCAETVNLVLPTGVTIRGDRRGTLLGPELLGTYGSIGMHMMEIQGNYVRITGLRLQGPTTATDGSVPSAIDAILVPTPNNFMGLLIDHNDISAWPDAAVEVYGAGGVMKGIPGDPSLVCPASDPNRNDQVHIERNFIHHNDENKGNGYGCIMSNGGAAALLGNTFLMNRHSIAADGDVRDQYSAWDNLVLSRAPVYFRNAGLVSVVEQTFDMHGAIKGFGGYAGSELDVAWNTFLPLDSDNFDVRGQSCGVDMFHNNVSKRNSGSAIEVWLANSGKTDGHYITASTPYVQIQNNQFADSSPGYSDPTVRLGVGNFDGDGVQDLFLATGAAWYYAPAGNAEWRYLNGGKTDRIDSLLLADVDGDGRTDIVGMNGGHLTVSWGGIGDWEVLNGSVPPGSSIGGLAVGDFDGDGRADIFYGDGKDWYVSSAGSGTFNYVQTSSFLVKDLRFGHFAACDFEGEKKTDVFGIVAGKWMVSCGATSSWRPLPVSLTGSIDGLIVTDFAGDGRADIAVFANPVVTPIVEGVVVGANVTDWRWAVSKDAAEGWTYHDITPTTQGLEPCGLGFNSTQLPLLPQQLTAPAGSLFVGIGRFSGTHSSDILLWGANFGNNFCIVAGGTGAAVRQSRQDMR
jgi:FG-GAP-like repeat